MVLHSLFADAIDGLATQFSLRRHIMMDIRLKHLHKKDLIFTQGGITLSRKWIPGYISVLHIKVYLLQRENTKNQEIVRHTDVISELERWKCPFMVPLQTILA